MRRRDAQAGVLAVIWGIFIVAERREPQGLVPMLPGVFSTLVALPLLAVILSDIAGRYTSITLTGGRLIARQFWQRKEIKLDDILYMRGARIVTASTSIVVPPIIPGIDTLRARIAERAPVLREGEPPPLRLPLSLQPLHEIPASAKSQRMLGPSDIGWLLHYSVWVLFLFMLMLVMVIFGYLVGLITGIVVGAAYLGISLLYGTRIYARNITFFEDRITVDAWLKRYEIPAQQVQRIQLGPLPTPLPSKSAPEIVVVKWSRGWLYVPLRAPEEDVAALCDFLAAQYCPAEVQTKEERHA